MLYSPFCPTDLQSEKTLAFDPTGKEQTATEQQRHFFIFDSQIQFLFGNLIPWKTKFSREPERWGRGREEGEGEEGGEGERKRERNHPIFKFLST